MGRTLEDGEYWAIFAKGQLALRFGPFTPKQAGKVIAQAVAESIPMNLVINGGSTVDWETIREMMKAPESENNANT